MSAPQTAHATPPRPKPFLAALAKKCQPRTSTASSPLTPTIRESRVVRPPTPHAVMMADPFEVRMQFTKQLQRLNATEMSAKKAASYALKYREMDEDLHSCILEQLDWRVSISSHSREDAAVYCALDRGYAEEGGLLIVT